MTRFKQAGPSVLIVILIVTGVGYFVGSIRTLEHPEASASESTLVEPAKKIDRAVTYVALQTPKASSTAATSQRDVYYPGTEDLKPNEMRVVALGTGMPTLRPKQRDPNAGDTFSDFTTSGKEPMPELIQQIYNDFNTRNGTDVPLPKK